MQLRYRSDIDGLRALAVIAVIVFHAFPQSLRGGFIGVDVFFVISGYLITTLLLQDQAAGKFSITGFYGRRIRRIFPALVVVLLASWLFGWVALLPGEYAELGREMAAAAGFASNLVRLRASGYFDAVGELQPLLHLWSLAIEEQFYLLWPLLLLAAWRWRVPVAALVLVLLVASLLVNLDLRYERMVDFYAPYTRFWELLIGAALACAMLQPQTRSMRWLSPVGVGLLLAGLMLSSPAKPYPGALAILPTVGTALLIAAGERGWLNPLIGWRGLAAIGRISYPLYLWHWPLLAYAHIIVGGPLSVALRNGLIAAAIVLAWLTYRYVERPLRFGVPAPKWMLPVLMLCIAALGLATYASGGLRFRAAGNYVDNRAELLRTVNSDADCATYVGAYAAMPTFCRYSNAGGSQTVALIGDSLAHVAYPGIAKSLTARGINTLMLANGGCPPFYQPEKLGEGGCAAQAAMLLDAVNAHPDIRHVFIFSRGATYTDVDAQGIAPRFAGQIFVRSLQASIDRLRAAGKNVYYVLENPETYIQPAACIPRPLRPAAQHCDIARARVEKDQANYRALVQQLHGVELIDPLPAFCDATRCRIFSDGQLLYVDDAHLSVAGSRFLAEHVLAKYLEAIVKRQP
jgi:peptidoglycan/LPS O-acetylase OafA/YrhL